MIDTAPKPPSRLLFSLAVLALLAAGVLAAFLVMPRTSDAAVTSKGNGFRVLVKRGDSRETVVAGNDTMVRPGDRLRFSYAPPADGYLAVFNLDGTERASVFFPSDTTRSAAVKVNGEALLDGTVTLDEAPGPEWMISVFRTEPFDVSWIAEQLRGQSKRGALTLDCPGCRVEMLRVQKGVQ